MMRPRLTTPILGLISFFSYFLSCLLGCFGATTLHAQAGDRSAPPPGRAEASAELPQSGSSDGWNTPRVLDLVRRGTQRRAAQLADTGLKNYKAEARGYLTFLGQLGEGFTEPPKIIRTDQIASDIYWRAPDFSKQLIKGRRDTLLLPTDIYYHRDHLGIVQNNFPNIIRLGDGDEVRDVPHPLSAAGLTEYDYAIRDSLQIHLGPRVLDVYEVRVRPKNDRAPRAIGSVYLDRESADVVRMTFSFTRAALKDKDLEDVSVVLENGLIDGRFWLPRRQELEIRRTATWMDYPARGIIRGRWEISDYEVNTTFDPSLEQAFAFGPEIIAAPGSTVKALTGTVTNPKFTFSGNILDSLPSDVSVATDADVRRVQEEARALVRGEALARAKTASVAARAVSDLVHVNRVEGLALGAGLTQRLGGGVSVTGGTTYGFSDHTWKPRGIVTYRRPSGASLSFSAYRTLQDVGDVPERSGVVNSFAAQEFGSDDTQPYQVHGASLTAQSSLFWPIRVSLGVAFERHDSASVHASPATGRYRPTLPIATFRETRFTLGADLPTRTFGATTLRVQTRANLIRGHTIDALAPNFDDRNWLRGSLVAEATHPFGAQTLVLRTIAAAVSDGATAPLEHQVYLGGPTSAPGYNPYSLTSDAAISQRLEWQFKVPFVGIPLGAWGRSPASLTVAPYVNAAWLHNTSWRPSVGVGALTLFDLVRFDVAKGTGRGGRWMFAFDVSRDFWSIL